MSCGKFTLNVLLNCVPTNSNEEKQLVFDTEIPTTVLDVKAQIQSTFKIPVCCQTLYHATQRLRNDEDIKSHRIRDGETVKVCYTSHADVDQVVEAVKVMTKMLSFIHEIQPHLTLQSATRELNARLSLYVKYFVLENVMSACFGERVSERADANRLLFIDSGGLNYLCQLHELLLKQPWHNTPLQMQRLEDSIVSIIWNLSCSSFTSGLLAKSSIIEAILQSFLRVKINGASVELCHNSFAALQGSQATQREVALNVIVKALGAICNIAENPDCRMQIALKQEALDQMAALSVTPFGHFGVTLLPISTFLNLAYSSDTHLCLATTKIMNMMIEACVMTNRLFALEQESLLLQYFCTVFFALLLLSSAHIIPVDFKLKICDFMDTFLKAADHTGIHECGFKYEHFWTTVAPYMTPAYYPYLNPTNTCTSTTHSSSDNVQMRKLEFLCMETGVFSLQTAVLDSEGMTVIENEGLVDYITCLPWNVPEGSKAQERAYELVQFLSKKIQLQPPPLLTIAKAKLAAIHFGLEKVLKVNSVHELLAEVCPPNI